MTLVELPEVYQRLFGLIPRGDDNPIPVADLARVLNIEERTVYELIHKLVTKYGVPVCSYRETPRNGFFIPLNEEQRARGLVSQKHQVMNQSKKIRAIEQADLNITQEYEKKYPRTKSISFLIPYSQTSLNLDDLIEA